ncbi:hypothetical protein [Marinoscillum sp.]|uniref:hypothetical protein n=1 Tax=Marinoscillum sp. TaxID=2024838 RepID=UPI003BAB992E
MRKSNKYIGLLLPLIHLSLMGGSLVEVQAQSGWTKGKDEAFFKLSYIHFSSDEYHNLSGESMTTATYRQQQVGVYGEYGVTERLTLLMDWPLLKWQGFESTETVLGTGDIRIGAKYALVKKIPISLTIMPELPIAQANKYARNDNPAFGSINLPTGDGEFNVYSTLAVSTSLYPLPGYVNFFSTYNFRTSYESVQLTDQMMEGLEVGYQPVGALWLKAGLKLQQTLNDSETAVSFVRGEGTEFTSYYLGAYYSATESWGVDFTFINYLDGPQQSRNIYQGPIFSLGLVYETSGLFSGND